MQQADLPVRSFSSGREFLDAYQPGELGCVVLDVRMPEMSGLDVQRELSARSVGLPIIFITAYRDVTARARAFRSGAFAFLEKPIDDVVLFGHIAKAMGYVAEQRQSHQVASYAVRMANPH